MTLISACADNSQAGSSSTAPQGGGGGGEQLFMVSCSACHGVGGVGIQGLGKPLTTSEFISQKSDEELLNFIKTGRPADDPLNTTGVLMPPKGGNPALTDEEIREIIIYLRAIQAQ
jgi:disulfide bond formation protein DsbB